MRSFKAFIASFSLVSARTSETVAAFSVVISILICFSFLATCSSLIVYSEFSCSYLWRSWFASWSWLTSSCMVWSFSLPNSYSLFLWFNWVSYCWIKLIRSSRSSLSSELRFSSYTGVLSSSNPSAFLTFESFIFVYMLICYFIGLDSSFNEVMICK